MFKLEKILHSAAEKHYARKAQISSAKADRAKKLSSCEYDRDKKLKLERRHERFSTIAKTAEIHQNYHSSLSCDRDDLIVKAISPETATPAPEKKEFEITFDLGSDSILLEDDVTVEDSDGSSDV